MPSINVNINDTQHYDYSKVSHMFFSLYIIQIICKKEFVRRSLDPGDSKIVSMKHRKVDIRWLQRKWSLSCNIRNAAVKNL